MCGFAALFIFSSDKIPLILKIVSGIFAGTSLLVTINGLIAGKPIVVADENGIQDRRLGRTIIRWIAIRAFRHSPRAEKMVNGRISFSSFKSWRPIQLWIDAPTDSAFTRLHRLARSPKHPTFPDALYLEIHFAGLDAPSDRLVELIREKATAATEEHEAIL